MCFSASASFTASALLIPVGIYCMKTAFDKNSAYLPLAAMPLMFGIQQGCEGLVWSGINSQAHATARFGAFGFLFFSHCVWLFWTPWLALQLESDQTIQQICRIFAGVGALYGAFLYLPLLIHPDWLMVAIAHSSIDYQAKFLGDAVPIVWSRLLYASTILVPLLISSNPNVKVFGTLITVFALLSYAAFNYAFVSVWCFFAALLSLHVVYILLKTDALLLEPALDETII
ncbi:MAG TPA: DUF6629 family protein [Chroococcidiopsis sp.]